MEDAKLPVYLQQRIDDAKAHMLDHSTSAADLQLDEQELLSLNITELSDEPRQLIAICRRIASYQRGRKFAVQGQLAAILQPDDDADTQNLIQTVDNLERSIAAADALMQSVFKEVLELLQLAIPYTGKNWNTEDEHSVLSGTELDEPIIFRDIVNKSIFKEQLAYQASIPSCGTAISL